MNIPELDELYALYRADLYRYLCRLTRDSAAAEDLLSETFLRALKGDCPKRLVRKPAAAAPHRQHRRTGDRAILGR